MEKFNPAYVAEQLEYSRESINDFLSGKRDCPKVVALAWAVTLGKEPYAYWTERQERAQKRAS